MGGCLREGRTALPSWGEIERGPVPLFHKLWRSVDPIGAAPHKTKTGDGECRLLSANGSKVHLFEQRVNFGIEIVFAAALEIAVRKIPLCVVAFGADDRMVLIDRTAFAGFPIAFKSLSGALGASDDLQIIVKVEATGFNASAVNSGHDDLLS
jgi:hypothetical protein